MASAYKISGTVNLEAPGGHSKKIYSIFCSLVGANQSGKPDVEH
ncbi:MAG: hypothetical protein ACJAZ0_001785 [Halioglobus sp.]|jgi:hypothetical protein